MNNNPLEPEKNFFALKMTNRQYMTTRKLFILAGTIILSLTLGITWASLNSSTTALVKEDFQQLLTVDVFPSQKVDSYTRKRHYTGLIHESRRSKLSFKRPGEVLEILVDEGDTVNEGKVLALLDDRHIKANQKKVESQLDEAKAVLDELIAGPRKETIAAKRAELQSMLAEKQVLTKKLERRSKLVEKNSVTREEFETYHFNLEKTKAQVDMIQAQLDELLEGTREEKIAAQRARLSQLEAQLKDIQHDLEDTKLIAPYSGRISQRLVDEGVVLQSGISVLELIDDKTLEAWVSLPVIAAETMNLNEKHQLLVDGHNLEGVVKSLSPDVSQKTRTRNIIFQIKTSGENIYPGQVVRIPVTTKVKLSGFWVPTSALSKGTRGLFSVYVAQENKGSEIVARHDVELLDTVGLKSFVRGSLQSGEMVVASGTHRIVPGQKIKTVLQEKSGFSDSQVDRNSKNELGSEKSGDAK